MKKINVFFLVLICVNFGSCRMNTAGISLVSGDFSPPKLLSLEVMNEKQLELSFSKEVDTVEITVAKTGSEEEGIRLEQIQKIDNKIIVDTPFNFIIGSTYTLEGRVKDKNGNTLSFLTDFSGYNNRVPKLILSEVRTEYTKPKVEFVEFYVQTAGNLAGVIFYNSYNGETAQYEFPACEVQEDEYIVLHMRSVQDGLVDEIDSLDASEGADALDTARDFWISGISARFNKNDVLLLYERKNGAIMDALLLSESKYTDWAKPVHAEAAKKAFESGAWGGGESVEFAVVSDYTTNTRTFSRQGDLSTAQKSQKSDWAVVDSSQATPGKANSNKIYMPK